MTANCKQSSNSTMPPWSRAEMKVFRRIMMRKCHMSVVDFLNRLMGLIDSVNGRSRYEHKLWLEKLGIEPNSKEAFKYTRARTWNGV